jgi:hypothetical protein
MKQELYGNPKVKKVKTRIDNNEKAKRQMMT